MEKKMKEKFYVFLDIDGTLWDWKTLNEKKTQLIELNEESVDALIVLLESIKKKYGLDLVISSRRRCDWEECMSFLKSNGFDAESYHPNMTQIERVDTPRGVKIAEYLKGKGEKLKLFPKPFQGFLARRTFAKMTNNFVVLDDNLRPLKDYVPIGNIILTNSKNRALDHEMVEEFLKDFGIEIVKHEKKKCVQDELKKPKKTTKKEEKIAGNEKELGEE